MSEPKSVQELVYVLCKKILGKERDAITNHYKFALTTLSSKISSAGGERDEFKLSERIKTKLSRQGRTKDAVTFGELHRRLQAQGCLNRRAALLQLLYQLSGSSQSGAQSFSIPSMPDGASLTTSTPIIPLQHQLALATQGNQMDMRTNSLVTPLGDASQQGSSGISSIKGSLSSVEPTPRSYLPSELQTPAFRNATASAAYTQQSIRTDSTISVKNQTASTLTSVSQLLKKSQPNTDEVTEAALVRDLIYVFQGHDGKYVKFDRARDGYALDEAVHVPESWCQAVYKLAEVGWMFGRVKAFVDSQSLGKTKGLAIEGLCAGLREELSAYYRMISVLETQVRHEEDLGLPDSHYGSLSLTRLQVMMFEPRDRLRLLACLVDTCQDKKGGSLASEVFKYKQHGDPVLRSTVRHLLSLVLLPLFSVTMRWIYDGVLEDPFHEFFVAFDPAVKEDRLWNSKYMLKKSLIPAFVTKQQADRILLTGKSVNFLRQVCEDKVVMRDREVVRNAETTVVEAMFEQDTDGSFQRMIDTVYEETSRHLLDVLHNKYHFMDHLRALRRYLLLGQGDFIRHMMDLLSEELGRSAHTIFLHNLTGTMETAIRATNAQYDDADILQRLDVRLLEASSGDTGWDVFSLDYHVDGPIRTVFTQECMVAYLRIFNFLWRAKRMEYVLASVWKTQTAQARLLRSMPELRAVLHQSHMLSCEMMHFVQGIQYYLSFEVLECAWDELIQQVEKAKDLDHVIAAHQVFLDTVLTRSLLDTQSVTILAQLRTIFDLIIQFEGIQQELYATANDELTLRRSYEQTLARREKEGKWGAVGSQAEDEEARKVDFEKTIVPKIRRQLRLLTDSYQPNVQQFLLMLAGHSDVCLRFLGTRLNFNEHYRLREPRFSRDTATASRAT